MKSDLVVPESFRDHIPYEDDQGKRKWIYPKMPHGRYHNYRILVTTILLGLFFTLPFIEFDGHPFFLFNIFERKFIIFNKVFWPQDTHLLIILVLIFFVSVILFTVNFGRIWCGWTCPQTVFMEMVFRKIEYWIEGDANQQKKLSRQPWNTEKILKKGAKHVVFILISFVISHTVMMYLIGKNKTIDFITHSPLDNLGKFFGLVGFTSIFYLVFSLVREHACTFICPYGRLQGVLINPETIVVAYDFKRGEPRGKLTKNAVNEKRGDCVECGLCVQVCPTGIDIRNGTQLECVNCTACIDACDEVMKKIEKPQGLIRYASLSELRGEKKKKFNLRTIGYSVVLFLLVGIFLTLILSRSIIETTILRAHGQIYNELPNGRITNLYNLQVVNKSFDPLPISFILKNIEGRLKAAGGKEDFIVPPQGLLQEILILEVEPSQIKQFNTPIKIEVISKGKVIDHVNSIFLGPPSKNIKDS